jgi:Phage Mu protein F like protein
MRRSRLHLIKQVSTQQKHVIRSVLTKALKEGIGPRQSARDLRQAIGLTDYQWQAVQNYRTALENGSHKVFSYELRDKRFDRTVENVIDSDDLLDDAQIDRMVERYTEGWLRYRSETIARTESIRTLSEARHSAWDQMINALDVDDEQIIRTWITTLDGRERDSHEEMHLQEVVGLDEPFLTPDDEEIYYPGDPSAPEEETIQCRCMELMRIEGSIG